MPYKGWFEVKIVKNENFIQKEEFYFQVGDGESDHSYWGRAEEMKMHRPSYKITPNKEWHQKYQ